MDSIGIYMTGLGQSTNHGSIEKYAQLFKNELSMRATGVSYSLKVGKTEYLPGMESTVVKIFRTDAGGNESEVYTFYEYRYHELLTKEFVKKNILAKNLQLFLLVLRKSPQIFLRMFSSQGFNRPYQTFYAFLILFIVSLCILFLVPAAIEFLLDPPFLEKLPSWAIDFAKPAVPFLKATSKYLLSLTALILILAPQSRDALTSMATEFACVDGYVHDGSQSQTITGSLDMLIEYIAEHEPGKNIHFHAYSFGCILAIDFLFPAGVVPPSRNTSNLVNFLVTIGNPYEFVNAYYPEHYLRRFVGLQDRLKWANVYSLSDALSTNFRKDTSEGEAMFGIPNSTLIPVNLHYEFSPRRSLNFFDFVTLYNLKIHKRYWDGTGHGANCTRQIVEFMVENGYITP